MVVCAIGDELVTQTLDFGGESLDVLDDLLLVQFEFWGLSLLEGDGERGDGVVVRAALVAGENGEVDGSFEIVQYLLASLWVGRAYTLAVEDHGTARSSKGFVCCRCDDVRIWER